MKMFKDLNFLGNFILLCKIRQQTVDSVNCFSEKSGSPSHFSNPTFTIEPKWNSRSQNHSKQTSSFRHITTQSLSPIAVSICQKCCALNMAFYFDKVRSIRSPPNYALRCKLPPSFKFLDVFRFSWQAFPFCRVKFVFILNIRKAHQLKGLSDEVIGPYFGLKDAQKWRRLAHGLSCINWFRELLCEIGQCTCIRLLHPFFIVRRTCLRNIRPVRPVSVLPALFTANDVRIFVIRFCVWIFAQQSCVLFTVDKDKRLYRSFGIDCFHGDCFYQKLELGGLRNWLDQAGFWSIVGGTTMAWWRILRFLTRQYYSVTKLTRWVFDDF